MNKISSFDRPTVQKLRKSLQATLDSIGKANGICLTLGNIRFDRGQFRTKLTAYVVPDGVNPTSDPQAIREMSYADAWRRQAPFYGFLLEHLGKTVTHNGSRYTIAGLKPTSRKYPIMMKRDDGKMFKFPEYTVKNLLLKGR